MNLKLIACRVLFREISSLVWSSEHLIDVTWLQQGFHNTPDLLRTTLQAEIDAVESGQDPHTVDVSHTPIDAILIGYGLCSNGILGVRSKKYPLVIPRGHDCITLLLGSKEKYREYFDSHHGVYWYTKGWIENSIMPGQDRYNLIRNQYVAQYGEENADYLMEMEQGWFQEYEWATFIDWPRFNNEKEKTYARECAQFLGWNFDVQPGNHTLLSDFLNGNWDDGRFLIVPPGYEVMATYDDRVIDIKQSGQG